MNIETAIEIRNVHKSFMKSDGGGEVNVLNGVTATVPNGTLVTLIGPSGAGKSTVLSLCNLLLTPDVGDVYIHGREVRRWAIPKLRQTVGLVFQAPTMFPGTVRDNIELGLKLQGRELDEPGKLLKQVGLSADLLEQQADNLSGGQKQRVALARILANKPDILLLDEVTSALDPASANEVEETILQIHKSQGATILWVTHNLEQARRVGEQTWLFVDGRLVETGSTAAFFDNPQETVTQQFLGVQRGGVLQS